MNINHHDVAAGFIDGERGDLVALVVIRMTRIAGFGGLKATLE